MKTTRIGLLFTVFIFVSIFCSAQGVSTYKALEKKSNILESQMKVAYQKLLHSLSQEERTLVSSEQNAWMSFRDTQLELIGYKNRNASGGGSFVLEEKIRQTKARILYLKELHSYFLEEKKYQGDPRNF